jgi:hypothetical protein
MSEFEMVTRVGRAIDAELAKAGITLPMQPVTGAMARAAIEAMREPNDKMLRVGIWHWRNFTSIEEQWQAMIDEALK